MNSNDRTFSVIYQIENIVTPSKHILNIGFAPVSNVFFQVDNWHYRSLKYYFYIVPFFLFGKIRLEKQHVNNYCNFKITRTQQVNAKIS